MTEEALADVHYEGIHCQLAIQSVAPGVVVIRLSGLDAGEFGEVPMQEVARRMPANRAAELFIDARKVRAASIEVSAEWAQWLAKHRARFAHISMLTGSRFIQLTANFVRRFAELGELMRIYTDPAAFDAALAESVQKA